ncbi:MAG: hypothetical protein U0794_06090 [Isosphaeraceae bacterium]
MAPEPRDDRPDSAPETRKGRPARTPAGWSLPQLSLLDVGALIAGYSLASLLVRVYWPDTGQTGPTLWEFLLIALVFLWLGLAMSGPAVLLIHRPPVPDPEDDTLAEPRTWAELAWMLIGFYWIGLTILVVPMRSNGARFVDSAVLGVFPVIAALVLRVVGPRQRWARARPAQDEPTWTHRAGIVLLVTWPLTWIGLIVLGQTCL